jgi:uncharacterized protein YbaP (TraB family)
MRILPEVVILTWMSSLRLGVPALLVLLLSACAAPPSAPRAPHDSGALVFWEVESGSRAGGRAFLLGSVHAGTPDLAFDPAIERAFGASQSLVIEADIAASQGEDAFGFVQRLLAMATLPEGETLDQLLPPPSWEQLGDFLRERGQPVEPVRRFEPWLVMTMVTSYLFAEAGLPAEGGVDLRFVARAEGRMPIVALETPEFQLSLLDSLPLEVQARMLAEVLARQGETAAYSTRIFDAWRLGDLDAIEAETLAPGRGDPKLREFHERVFLERNRTMAERIDGLLAEEKTWFVVVGAGHMVGDEGIPSLLARRGHRVARVPKTAAAPAPAPE